MLLLTITGFKNMSILIPATWTFSDITNWINKKQWFQQLMADIEAYSDISAQELTSALNNEFWISGDNGIICMTIVLDVSEPTIL